MVNVSLCVKNVNVFDFRMQLTDGVSGKDGVCGGAGESRSSSIDGSDSKQVLGALDKSAHHERLAQAHGTDGVAGHASPAFACGLFTLQPVASDGGTTVVLWLLPVHRHGVHGDAGDRGLLTLTRGDCRTGSTRG